MAGGGEGKASSLWVVEAGDPGGGRTEVCLRWRMLCLFLAERDVRFGKWALTISDQFRPREETSSRSLVS